MNTKKTGSIVLALAALAIPFNGAIAQSPTFYRVDCRFHNVENIPGLNHCYASAVYGFVPNDSGRADGEFVDVQFGVGCDGQTIYNNSARVHDETVANRISPKTAAFPAIELQPQDALLNPTTYDNSRLDIREGILEGVCYVQILEDREALDMD